jgi:hypothetical protein
MRALRDEKQGRFTRARVCARACIYALVRCGVCQSHESVSTTNCGRTVGFFPLLLFLFFLVIIFVNIKFNFKLARTSRPIVGGGRDQLESLCHTPLDNVSLANVGNRLLLLRGFGAARRCTMPRLR